MFDTSKKKYEQKELIKFQKENPFLAEIELFCPTTNTNHYFIVKPMSYTQYRDYLITLSSENVKNIKIMFENLCKESILYPKLDDNSFDEYAIPPAFVDGLIKNIEILYAPTDKKIIFKKLEAIPNTIIEEKLIEIRKTKRFAYWYKIFNPDGIDCNFIINKMRSGDRLKIVELIRQQMDSLFDELFDDLKVDIVERLKSTLIPPQTSIMLLIDGNLFQNEFQNEDPEFYQMLEKKASLFNDKSVLANMSTALDNKITQIYFNNIFYSDVNLDGLPHQYLTELINELRTDIKLIDQKDILAVLDKAYINIDKTILDKLSTDDLTIIINYVYGELLSG